MAVPASEKNGRAGQTQAVFRFEDPPLSRLDEVMKALRIRPAELAARTGKDAGTIMKWRKRAHGLRIQNADFLASFLGVPAGVLLEPIGAPIPRPDAPSPAAGEVSSEPPQDEDDLAFITRLLPELDAAGLTMVRATVTYLINGMRVDRAHLIPMPAKRNNDPT